MEDKLYFYKAKCYYVTDGDTIKAMVDVGFKMHVDVIIRFMGINTPETRTRNLPADRDWETLRLIKI